MGSHFHRGHVSRGPPIIPDGRVSRVRFETLAFPPWVFPSSPRVKRWLTYAPVSVVYPKPRSASCVGFIAGSVSGLRADDETAKCPESLCPILALPPSRRRTPPPRKTLLLRPCSYGLMRRSHLALPYFSFCLVGEVFAGCYQPLLPPGSSRRYLCQSFPRCLDPYHDGLQVAFTCCFPCNIGLPQKSYGSACRETPLKRLRSGEDFRGCNHFFMFRPPSLLATLVAPTTQFPAQQTVTSTSEQNMLRYLGMHRIC